MATCGSGLIARPIDRVVPASMSADARIPSRERDATGFTVAVFRSISPLETVTMMLRITLTCTPLTILNGPKENKP